MPPAPPEPGAVLAPPDDAPQHRPRPLPLFLHMLRSEMGGDPVRMADALAGLRAYQQAPRPPAPTRAPEIARRGHAVIRAFGQAGRPVLFVPSLINGAEILDLDADRSLLRWLAGQGVRPLLLDWGTPDPADRALDIAAHVERRLLPLIDDLGETPILAGYCLGGTMALAAAALRRPPALALIAAPWRFAGFGAPARQALAALWTRARDAADALGLLPMEVLQTAFWQIDPARTLAKYERFGAGPPPSAAALRRFAAVEDWANGGPPLTFAAARELMEGFFAADRPGTGGWRVGDRLIDPAALRLPVLDIVSTDDRIVPAASAAAIGRRLSLDLGHVGMIVGGRARTALWQPLATWLRAPL